MIKETIAVEECSYFSIIPAILYFFFILYSYCKKKFGSNHHSSNFEINHILLPENSREVLLNQKIPISHYIKQRISILIIGLFVFQITFEIIFFLKKIVFIICRIYTLIIWIASFIIAKNDCLIKLKGKYFKNVFFWHTTFLYDLVFLLYYYVKHYF